MSLKVGSVVSWKPTRPIFAISSGSWTGQPSKKERPCVVVAFTGEGLPIVAPLCGAKQLNANQWGRRDHMVHQWWQPVNFTNIAIPTPFDGCTVQRAPITIAHDSRIARPAQFPNFKPSYIWAGDAGQVIPSNDLRYLATVSPYLELSAAEVEHLSRWWKYWKQHYPVPR
ncbi:hypothetical protein JB92DRAFT_2916066 [Gautieria morchelliformis]|nr:hypothetical protein JB92DRAFT_2916066 [Gautieria morchelliformis]